MIYDGGANQQPPVEIFQPIQKTKNNNNLFRDDCTREFAFTLRHCRRRQPNERENIKKGRTRTNNQNKKEKKKEKVNALGGQQSWIDSGNGNNFASATAVAGEMVVVMDVDDLRW